MKKNNKGITLIALVITIIVLIILVIVTVKLVTNEQIITRAEGSAQKYKQSSIEEKAKLLISSAKVMSKSDKLTLDSLKAVAQEENIQYTENDSESIICTIEDQSVLISENESITILGKALSIDAWSIDDNGKIGLNDKTNLSDYTKIIIPNRIGDKEVKQIADGTFSNSAIEYISIPDTVTKIGTNAFYNCTSLKEIQMPCKVTLGNNAFTNCTKVQKVTLKTAKDSEQIGGKDTKMPWYQTNSDIEIVISEGITEIGDAAFADAGVDNLNHITKVTIPSTIATFGNYTFSGCTSLQEVNIAEGLKAINNGTTFFNCTSLTQIIIPRSVTEVVSGLFLGCTNLNHIYFRGNTITGFYPGDNCPAGNNNNSGVEYNYQG